MDKIQSKEIAWLGTALCDVRIFPDVVKREIGHDLYLVQQGILPRNYKNMPNLGSGVTEIKQRDKSGNYRLVYVAKFPTRIYVLHGFIKKTQKTSTKDINLIKQRYKEIREIENGQ